MSTYEVLINGERYVRFGDAGPIKIVILERGFIYIGRVDNEVGPDITIHGARSLIRWGTTKHLGQLAQGPLEGTSLGDPCNVQCRVEQIIHMIEVSQDAWKSHIS